MFKIQLPSPEEMSIPTFFAQMRIAITAAEKSYQSMVKGKEPSKDDDPWIRFENDEEIMSAVDKIGDNEVIVENSDDAWQKIYLVINSLRGDL